MDPSWDMLPIYYHEILPIGSQYDSHLTNGTNTSKYYYSPFHNIRFPFNIPIRFPWDHIPWNIMKWNCLPPHAPSRWAPPRTRLSASAATRTAGPRARGAHGALEGSRRWLPCRWLSNLAPCNLGNVKPNGFLKPSETHFLNMLKPWKPMFFCFCLVGLVYPVCHIMVGNSGCKIVRTLGPTVWPIFRDGLTSH